MQPQHHLKSILAVLTILILPAAMLFAFFRNVSPDGGGHGGSTAVVAGKDGGISPTKVGGGGHGDIQSNMGGDMDTRKKTEGASKPSAQELYPALVSLSDLTPEQREQVRSRADELMRSGAAMLGEGLARLSDATERQDYAAMQEAAVEVRKAFTLFETGLAARRALADDEPDSQVAPQSFNGEMNFLPSRGVETRAAFLGFAPFHRLTMVPFAAFPLRMVAMYPLERRRAAVCLMRISTDAGSPPAGWAPPLARVRAADVKAAMPEVTDA